jgi:hypothetical protein
MYVIWAHHTSGSGALFNWDSRLGFTNKSVRLDFFAGGWVWKLDGGPQKREAPKCCLIVNFWGNIYIYVNMLHLRAWKRLACVDRKWLYNCNWGRILAPSYSRHNDLSKNLTKQDNTQKIYIGEQKITTANRLSPSLHLLAIFCTAAEWHKCAEFSCATDRKLGVPLLDQWKNHMTTLELLGNTMVSGKVLP